MASSLLRPHNVAAAIRTTAAPRVPCLSPERLAGHLLLHRHRLAAAREGPVLFLHALLPAGSLLVLLRRHLHILLPFLFFAGLLFFSVCLIACVAFFSGCQNGRLEVRRGSPIVPKVSAVSPSGLEEGEARVWTGSVNPIIVIDNYDSFTYNLCQYMGELGANFEVYRNDELTIEEMKRKKPKGILISPGPGTPQDSGISLETVLELGPSTPLFGVCMGLQCIGQAFGGKIVRSPHGVMHGKSSLIYYDEKGGNGLFSGLPNPFAAGRYHSLVIENDSFPSDFLEITAWTEDGLIMAARHKKYRHIQGVQFHPESVVTLEGKTMVQNFINLIEIFELES